MTQAGNSAASLTTPSRVRRRRSTTRPSHPAPRRCSCSCPGRSQHRDLHRLRSRSLRLPCQGCARQRGVNSRLSEVAIDQAALGGVATLHLGPRETPMTDGETGIAPSCWRRPARPTFLRTVAEAVVQLLMESRRGRADRRRGGSERSPERLNWRNGYRDRTLGTPARDVGSCGSPSCARAAYFPPFPGAAAGRARRRWVAVIQEA